MSCYHHIRIHEDDRPNTTFTTLLGLHQWKIVVTANWNVAGAPMRQKAQISIGRDPKLNQRLSWLSHDDIVIFMDAVMMVPWHDVKVAKKFTPCNV